MQQEATEQGHEETCEKVNAATVIQFYSRGISPAKKLRKELHVAKCDSRSQRITHVVLNKNKPLF